MNAGRILFLFGIGFLLANVKVVTDLVKFQVRKRSALLTWENPKPPYYGLTLGIGAMLGLLVTFKLFVQHRPLQDVFGETMMFIYYGYTFPLSTRIARGFYRDGVWADTGFLRWGHISAFSWKEEGRITLLLVSHFKSIARRLEVPGHLYGEARKLLREKIKAQDIHVGGAGLDLGSRRDEDTVGTAGPADELATIFCIEPCEPIKFVDMPPRPTWKGFMKVSLVNIPVKVFPATESAATLSFNQLHAECRTRIQQKRWCPKCDREVPNTELVKGYEFEKGQWVVIDDEDLQKVRVESTRVINLVQFADDTEIDPIYIDRAYYLAPDGPMAAEAFAVMREGMAGKAGIGKVALYGREYLVAIRPQKKGLVMYTLHHDAEIRSIDQIDELNSVPSKVKPEEIKLAKQVINTFDAELNLKDYKDEYTEGLRKIIDAKIAGQEIVAPEIEEPQKVVDLMEALRRSLDSVSTTKKKPAKAQLEVKGQKAKVKAARSNGVKKVAAR